MGNWNLTIQGTGCHHNNNPAIDINLLAPKLVQQIKSQGHSIQSATLTCGGTEDLLLTGQPESRLEPHQQRVVDEKAELDDKRAKLGVFIESNPVFAKLPADERERLVRQASCMTEYSDILGERIAAFPAPQG